MTCIVDPKKYPTKKSLRQALLAKEVVSFRDPSIVATRTFTSEDMRVGEQIVVTNHPKRSWFAEVTKTADRFLVK